MSVDGGVTSRALLEPLLEAEIVEIIPAEVLARLREVIRGRKTGEIAFVVREGTVVGGHFTDNWPVRA